MLCGVSVVLVGGGGLGEVETEGIGGHGLLSAYRRGVVGAIQVGIGSDQAGIADVVVRDRRASRGGEGGSAGVIESVGIGAEIVIERDVFAEDDRRHA